MSKRLKTKFVEELLDLMRGKLLILTAIIVSISSCTIAKRQSIPSENREVNASREASNEANVVNPPPVNDNRVVAQDVAPDALLRDLYRIHDQDLKASNDRILNGKSRALLDKFFSKNLADLIWKDLTTNKDEVGVIDFDLFYNTQDPNIQNFSIGQGEVNGENATIPVNFNNSGAKETVTYVLAKVNGSWKITDIKYRDGGSLVKYFKEGA
jgi:hypothetical protein